MTFEDPASADSDRADFFSVDEMAVTASPGVNRAASDAQLATTDVGATTRNGGESGCCSTA